MIRLTYVSRSAVVAGRHGIEVSDIVATAQARNAVLGVTGALIHTQGYFAQVLEGNSDDVEELIVSIRRDPRHTEMRITETCEITERRFKSWMQLVYHGGATYIEHTLRATLGGNGLTVAARPLLLFFEKLSEEGGIHHGPELEV